jgi:hypothetical protein
MITHMRNAAKQIAELKSHTRPPAKPNEELDEVSRARLSKLESRISGKYRELDLTRDDVVRLRHRVYDKRDNSRDNDFIRVQELTNEIKDLQRQITSL